MQHLKVNVQFFLALKHGVKNFEVRREIDRKFYSGEIIALHEWDPVSKNYTGNTVYRRIGYLVRGPFPEAGLPEGTVVLGLKRIEESNR